MTESLLVSIADTNEYAVDAGAVSAFLGQADRLRHRRIVSDFAVVAGKFAVPPPSADIVFATAGRTDWESIVSSEVDVVLVQAMSDTALPAGPMVAVAAAIRAGAPVAVPVLPVTDTIKSLTPAGLLRSTVDRSELRRVLSPWACAPALLRGPISIPAEGLSAMPWQLGAPVLPVEVDHPVATVPS